MGDLESQEEDAPHRVLWNKPMTWLGVIRPHPEMSARLLVSDRTFFAMSSCAQIPAIVELSPSTCGCKRFALDALGDHVRTCTDQSGDKKTHDWAVEQLTTQHIG